MTVTKLIKILQQAKKNGQGDQQIMVEVKDIDGLKYEYGFDMYHCERQTPHHYNILPLIPFNSANLE